VFVEARGRLVEDQHLRVDAERARDRDHLLHRHRVAREQARDVDVEVQAGEQGIRFLLVSGKPIEEPVAWYGPIVMNTQTELRDAMRELQLGTFIR